MNSFRSFWGLILPILCIQAATSQASPIVEMTVSGTSYQGLNIAHNDAYCWLAARDGSYERIELSKVKSFRKPGGEFRTVTPSAMAGTLRSTLGRQLEIETRGHFIICAPSGQASQYADLIAGVEKSFTGYFNRRGWPLATSDFPLVVIVLRNRKEFDQSCMAAGMAPNPTLKGFYHPQTNRVTLYDQSAEQTAGDPKSGKKSNQGGIDELSRKVAVHETIHQLAFNAGLHQRIGENPRWVVEGLATVLEAGALSSTDRLDTAGRANPERLKQFQEYRSKRRTGTILDLIQNDEDLYKSAPLDFYSEAWAFTFYLSEAKRPDYVRYLKKVATRDPMAGSYPPEERLADFQSVFGKDLRWMETQFQRFIDKLP